jgi:hypothetical protein
MLHHLPPSLSLLGEDNDILPPAPNYGVTVLGIVAGITKLRAQVGEQLVKNTKLK